MAALQLATAITTIWFLPDQWSTIFSLSPRLVQAVMVAGALMLALIASVGWRTDRAARVYHVLAWLGRSWLWMPFALGLIVFALLFLPSPWVGQQMMAVQALLVGLLLYLAGQRDRVDFDVWVGWAVLAVALIGMVLRLVMVFQGISTDEGHYLSLADGFVHGSLVPPISGFPASLKLHPAWGLITIGTYGVWAKLFGVGMLQIRMQNFVIGLVALLPMYAAIRLWYGKRAALISVSVAMISIYGLQSSAGRNNALPVLFYSLTLYVHLKMMHRNATWGHALVGVLAGLAVETHLLALGLVAAMGGYYGIDLLGRIIKRDKPIWQAPLWYFLLGVVPLLASYYLIRVLTFPDSTNYDQTLGSFSASGGVMDQLAARIHAFGERSGHLLEVAPIELALLVLSTVAALARRTKADQHWLLLLLFNQIGYFIIHPTGTVNMGYTAFPLPLLFSGVGPLVMCGFSSVKRSGWLQAQLAFAVITVFVLAFSIENGRTTAGYRATVDARRRADVAVIRAAVQPSQTVLAFEDYYEYLLDYPVVIPPNSNLASVPPQIANQPFDAYWQSLFLDRWPAAFIETDYQPPSSALDSTTMMGSYFLALNADHPAPRIWVAQKTDLITRQITDDPSIQLVAHYRVPAIEGVDFELVTVWAIREAVPVGYAYQVSLIGGIILDEGTLRSSSGQGVEAWGDYRFEQVLFPLRMPETLPAGDYTLHIEITDEGGTSYDYELQILTR